MDREKQLLDRIIKLLEAEIALNSDDKTIESLLTRLINKIRGLAEEEDES